MNKYLLLILSLLTVVTMSAQNDKTTNSDNGHKIMFRTTAGDIVVKLYDDTPAHRDNILKLVKEGYYDGMLFHRVINNFMIQTGDPNSKNPDNTIPLGAGDPAYTLPAEIHYPQHFHKFGALAAARTADQVNPERRSSGSQFYIVTGQKYSMDMLKKFEQRANYDAKQTYFNNLVRQHMDQIRQLKAASDTAALNALQQELISQTEANVTDRTMPDEVIQAYTTIGGTPHLDGAYTVFGEVISGMEVVDAIQKAGTDSSDRPLEDIRIISATLVKE